MSNWTEVTVTQLDGKELDPAVVQAVFEKHTGMDWYEGDHPDWVQEIIDREKDYRDPDRYLPNKAAVRGTQTSKYMVEADWAKVSRKLTKKCGRVRLLVEEEWGDEEPGKSENVWVAGVHLPAESATSMLVNDILVELIDVQHVPTVLVAEQVVWDGTPALPGYRFIVVPPKGSVMDPPVVAA